MVFELQVELQVETDETDETDSLIQNKKKFKYF